jgi:hypothetical protein
MTAPIISMYLRLKYIPDINAVPRLADYYASSLLLA